MTKMYAEHVSYIYAEQEEISVLSQSYALCTGIITAAALLVSSQCHTLIVMKGTTCALVPSDVGKSKLNCTIAGRLESRKVVSRVYV